jgi:hypothetical protein
VSEKASLRWDLVLRDAANNCIERNAVCVIALRSGLTWEGKINKKFLDTYPDTVTLEEYGGGNVEIDKDEIAVVHTKHGSR